MLAKQLNGGLDTQELYENEGDDNWIVIDFPKELYQNDDIGCNVGSNIDFPEELYRYDDIGSLFVSEDEEGHADWTIIEFPKGLYQDDDVGNQVSSKNEKDDEEPVNIKTLKSLNISGAHLDDIINGYPNKAPESPQNAPIFPLAQKQAGPDWSKKEDRALIPNRMADDIKKAADILNFGGTLYLYVGPGFVALTDEVECIKRLKSIMKSKYLDNIPEYAWGICRRRLLTDPYIGLDEKDRNKYRNEFLAVFANGVIFDSPKEIRKSKPEYMIFTFCAIEYHPKNRHRHNGVFDRFIYDISGGDEEIEDLLLCAMASMLLPSVSFKKAFMLLGKTNSGKSVIMWLLRQIIGGNNIAAVNIQQFANNHQLSEFVGKIANIRPDASTDTISSEQMGIFKSLVSGGLDVINATKKFSSDLTLHTDTFQTAQKAAQRKALSGK